MNIKLEPFKFIRILKWESNEKIGSHGELIIEGVVSAPSFSEVAKHLKSSVKEPIVISSVVNENDEEIVTFCGRITAINQSPFADNEFKVAVKIKTSSYLLDIVSKTRSFQTYGLTYRNVVESCLETDEFNLIVNEQEYEEEISNLLLQYKETNWNFTKRIASKFNLPVIANSETEDRNIYIGLPKAKKDIPKIETENYKVSITPMHTGNSRTYFELTHSDIYRLGECVSFDGEVLRVVEVKRFLQNNEVLNTYVLSETVSEEMIQTDHINLCNTFVLGEVVDINRGLIKMKINGDENADNSEEFIESRWLSYGLAPFRSSKELTWYMMPEIGDEVRLVFESSTSSSFENTYCINK